MTASTGLVTCRSTSSAWARTQATCGSAVARAATVSIAAD